MTKWSRTSSILDREENDSLISRNVRGGAAAAKHFEAARILELLRADIGEVIKKIVDAEAFPHYQIPKKPTGQKKAPGHEVRMNVPRNVIEIHKHAGDFDE